MKIGLSASMIGRGQTGVGQYVFGLLRALIETAQSPVESSAFGRLPIPPEGGTTNLEFLHPGSDEIVVFALADDLPLFDFARPFVQIISVPEAYRPAVKNIFWHQTKLPRLIRDLGIDVMHIPSYRRLLWNRPCPRVGTIHDIAPCVLKNKYDAARMWYGKVAAKYLARRQDKIIAVSRSTANDIDTHFQVPPDRVTVVYNGLDQSRFFPAPSEPDRRWMAERFGVTGPFFLYVARLEHPAKNHCRLIEAFNQFKTKNVAPWKLVFAGSDCQGAEEIHNAIRRSPCQGDIVSLGFISDAELPRLYRAAEIFIYPSLYEGFGLPPLEAMACGCPVIASDRGALKEVVGKAACVIDPENIHSMAGAMKSLASDGCRREIWRKAGLTRAADFDWKKTAGETLQVYRSAAALKTNKVSESSPARSRVEKFAS